MTDMIRTYRKEATGKLRFRDTWVLGDPPSRSMAVHTGVVGNPNGSLRTIQVENRARYFTDFLADARAQGYREMAEDEYHLVIVQCRFADHRGDTAAEWILEHGATAVSEHLRRRGLGHVDECDYGNGILNILCPVIDAPLAVTALRTIGNKNPRFKGRFTIGVRDELGDWTTAWPRPGDFALF